MKMKSKLVKFPSNGKGLIQFHLQKNETTNFQKGVTLLPRRKIARIFVNHQKKILPKKLIIRKKAKTSDLNLSSFLKDGHPPLRWWGVPSTRRRRTR